MKTPSPWLSRVALATVVLSLNACAGMTEREKNTAIGAGAGAVGGAIISGGSPLGTAGGAAVGAVIGNQIEK